MPLSEKMNLLFKPWWSKSQRNRVEGILLALTNISMQAAVYIATTPQTVDSTTADALNSTTLVPSNCTQVFENQGGWNAYAPIIVPIFTTTVNTVIFTRFQQIVANALQQSIIKRLLSGEEDQGINEESSSNIGLIQIFAEPQLSSSDIENFGMFVSDASNYCEIIEAVSNIAPMLLYLRMAYLNLPEARNVLYVGGAVTSVACALQWYLFSLLVSSNRTIKEKDIEIQGRMGRNIRRNDAIVGGVYQNKEETTLNGYADERNSASLRFNASVAGAHIINNLVYLGLSVVTLFIVNQEYPQLRGAPGTITFSYAMNLFAGSLLQVIYTLGDKYPKANVGLNKLILLDNLLKQMYELKNNPFLNIKYTTTLSNTPVDKAIQFSNFYFAIPPEDIDIDDDSENETDIKNNYRCLSKCITSHVKKLKPEATNIKDKINAVMQSQTANFINLPQSFSLDAGKMYRIYGGSGIGKSRFFATLLGIWPYATGDINFYCSRNEIYVMPQEQLFVKGSLLENIYYPDPVPNGFIIENNIDKTKSTKIKYDLESSLDAKILCQKMRQIGLDKEINRLGEVKDWGGVRDLSPGMEKRFSFLRMYMKAISGQHLPKIIMIDEANSGVDGQNGYFMEGLIRELRIKFPDVCVIFIKHDLDVHPELFNDDQKELAANDPDIFKGLTECEIIDLKRCTKPRLVAAETDPELGNYQDVSTQRYGLFFTTRSSYNKVPVSNTDEDIDIEDRFVTRNKM